MDFKISDTNRGTKSLLHNGYSYRIDDVPKSGDISWRCTNKKCKGRFRADSANGRTMVESRYHKFGLDSIAYTLKIPVKAINFRAF